MGFLSKQDRISTSFSRPFSCISTNLKEIVSKLPTPTARLILDPDYETVVWNKEERMKGQAWGLKTVDSFHTRDTLMPQEFI